jgi:hypothetical protein
LPIGRDHAKNRLTSAVTQIRSSTAWNSVTPTDARSKLSGRSVAVAAFGVSCNLLFLFAAFYQEPARPEEWHTLVLPAALMLAPSLVLLIFRQHLAVVFIYTTALFWILVWRIEYPHEYYAGQKYDNPGVVLVFFGLMSVVILTVWAAIRLIVLVWRAMESNRVER